jgi:hypothetical protein
MKTTVAIVEDNNDISKGLIMIVNSSEKIE